MPTFKVERVLEDAIMPAKAHESDAGFDLYSPIDFMVHGHTRKVIDLGIRIELSDSYEAQIRSRSGLAAKKGVVILNGIGTIDPHYRGNIQAILYNTTFIPVRFKKGDRIAQMVIKRFPDVELIEDSVSENTERGVGGLGSSGS